MPKSPNQKLKLLYLMEILLQQTDERHPMTVPEMISELARHGVAAERKSIYNDLESLRTFGLDIVQTKSRTTGYYIGARSFEVPELKLLVDSVQSSKFITHKKTLALIKKIEGLASIYDAQLLQRQVYVRGRPGPGAKTAVTLYKTLAVKNGLSLVECDLITGRTHQIRVHMKHIGHVLFNDERYGGHEILKGTHFSKYKQFVNNCFDTCPRQALHAMTLGFVHPVTGEEMNFTSELPDDMAQLIEKWRGYISNRELE